MHKLSTIIITKNEEHNIRRCLESVKWTDEVIIYDSGSQDNTINICKEYNCEIYNHNVWEGFGKAKHEAVCLAKNDWVFVIDADEECSEGLQKKILSILSSSDAINGVPTNKSDRLYAYTIKRNPFYLGKEIKHSGWQRDYTLRLFNRQYGNFNDKIVHEYVEVNTPIGRINEVLYHYTYPNIKTHLDKMLHYSRLNAEQLLQKRKKGSICSALFHAIGKFFKMYILNAGFLDGKVGFILAINSAFGVWIKYIYHWESVWDNCSDSVGDDGNRPA